MDPNAIGVAHRRIEPASLNLVLYRDVFSRSRQQTGPSLSKFEEKYRNSLKEKIITPDRLSGTMPTEVLRTIMSQMDMASLGNMRQTNSWYMSLVGSIREYCLLCKHASHTIGVMCATKIVSCFSLHQLFAEFCHPWCRNCGDGVFGSLIFLPTLSRCCKRCLMYEDAFELATVSDVMMNFGLPLATIRDRLPIVEVLTGIYKDHYDMRFIKRRRKIVSVFEAKKLALKIYGSDEGICDAADARYLEEVSKYENTLKEWQRQNTNRTIQKNGVVSARRRRQPPRPQILSTPLLSYKILQKWRHMGSTDLPYWNEAKQTAEPGVYCSYCILHCISTLADGKQYEREIVWRGKYEAFLMETIPQHFKKCPFFGLRIEDRLPTEVSHKLDHFYVYAGGARGPPVTSNSLIQVS